MAEDKKTSVIYQVTIIGILFFIFGFSTWVNGTLIPYFKIACELSDKQSYLVATAFYISYFFMALPSSWILNKSGFKNGMVIGLIIMAIGAFMFIPAAHARDYKFFLFALFIIGTGLALLQTAANPYVTVVGPIESAAQRISIMGVFNKIGGKTAILIFGAIALKDSDKIVESLKGMAETEKIATLNELILRVVKPYTVIGLILLATAIVIYFIKLPKIEEDIENDEKSDPSKTSIFQFPYALFGALAIFFYVGVEVIAGDTIALYGKSMGIALDSSKYYPIITLACMLIGYFIGIVCIPKFISQANALILSAILGILLSVVILATKHEFSVLCVGALGLANAVMWPAIFPLSIEGLGRFTKTGSALLIMGIAGGALMPLAYGGLADASNRQLAYLILIPSYIYILWFAWKGHKVGRQQYNS